VELPKLQEWQAGRSDAIKLDLQSLDSLYRNAQEKMGQFGQRITLSPGRRRNEDSAPGIAEGTYGP
jgi:hypothetical protein